MGLYMESMHTVIFISHIYSVFLILFWEMICSGDKVTETGSHTKSYLYLRNNARLFFCSSME